MWHCLRMLGISAWALLLARSNATILRGAAGSNVTEDPVLSSAVAVDSEDPCRCLNWKQEVYSKHICGVSNEFYFVTKISQPAPEHALMVRMAWHQYCDRFYEKMDNNICFNINIGKDVGQWCFVDAKCTKLDGGGYITRQPSLRWKKCTAGVDDMLRSRTVEEVIEFTQTYDVSFNIAGQMAWPSFPMTQQGGGTWQQLRGYYLPNGDASGDAVLEEDRQKLDKMSTTRKPFMIDSNFRHTPPQVIVDRGTLYSVQVKKHKKMDMDHPGDWCDVREMHPAASIGPPFQR